VEWANANFSVSTKDWRRIYFAWRRVYRIRALLGDVIDSVIDDQVKKFYDEDGAQWDPETWKNFLPLIDREAQKKHLALVSNVFDPSSDRPMNEPRITKTGEKRRDQRSDPRSLWQPT
jgi:hypothetical protein